MQLELLPSIAASLGCEKLTHFATADLVSLLQKFDQSHKILLSEVVKVGKLMQVMPTTNATNERSFSALKIVKTYLRSTTTDTRMNNLMVLHIHKSETDKLDLMEVANEFIQGRDSRKSIFGTF